MSLLRLAAVVASVFWAAGLAAAQQPPSSPASQPASGANSAVTARVFANFPFDAAEAQRRSDETAADLAVPKITTLDLGNGVTMEFMLIPAGKFVMGSPANEPGRQSNETHHEVTVAKPFYIAITKVTQEQYEQVMGVNPSKFAGKGFPVDSVSWDKAVAFCDKLSVKARRRLRLPTEAQWEYACRAGTASAYNFGDDANVVGDYAWYRENNDKAMHAVGKKKPNAWGLYDMHGLLWEWCSDVFVPSGLASRPASGPDTKVAADANAASARPSTTRSTKPTTAADDDEIEHSARGGTWGSRAPFLRSAIRVGGSDNVTPDALSRFGFRPILDAD